MFGYKLEFKDKFIIGMLISVFIIRAPYVFIPMVIIIYMISVFASIAKKKEIKREEKKSKTEMKEQIARLEKEVESLRKALQENAGDQS